MDIRQAGFWPDIADIFLRQIHDTRSADEPGTSNRLCRYHQFTDRLEISARRAKRQGKYVGLILLHFAAAKERLDVGRSGRQLELLLCRVSSCLRSSDSVCDLGGSRFAILLDDIKEPSVLPMVIEKLDATLMGRFKAGSQASGFRLNFAASLFPKEDIPVAQIWRDTAAALERAITAGAGGYSISPMATGQDAMERFELSKDLYKAYRNNEFEISYQPIMDFAENRMCAFEGLLRWRHPVRGSLAPDVFLPLLEESGLIVPVGERLLKQACLLASGLINEQRENLRVCINVSARQLTDGGFLLSVFDALYEAGLDPSLLQLEFSETVLIQNREVLQRVLPELKNAGVQLAIDRFGTGDAPLTELVRMPVNLIKLDPSLVNRIVEDPVSQVIATGTLALARVAQMSVAAVGVEQGVQVSVLERMGCCEAQGRYFSRPLSALEITAAFERVND